ARHALRHRRPGPRTRRLERARHPPRTPRHGRPDRQRPQDTPRPPDGQHDGDPGRLPGRTPPGHPRPRRPPRVLQPAPRQAQPWRHRMDHRQIPGPDERPATRRRRRQPAHPAPLQGYLLYEAGVPLPYIRDILGHVDLSTTEIYARASIEAKRKALEAAYTNITPEDQPEWTQDHGLLDWLTNL